MTKDQGFSINRRLKWAGTLAVVCTLAIQARLFQLQILRHIPQGGEGASVVNKNFVWQADKGLILDRNGRKLVSNTQFETLVAHPSEMKEHAVVARALEPILGVSASVLEGRLRSKSAEKALRRKLPADAVRQLRELRIPGVEVEEQVKKARRSNSKFEYLEVPGLALMEEPDRHYLKKELAGQIIGWVDIDNVGQGGIENCASEKLEGTTSTVQVRKYGDRRAILSTDYTRTVPIRGADVVLTLDETIQWIAERALYDLCSEKEAKSGTAIVMEPTSGEILAMANYPPFEPEKVGEYAEKREMERAKNNCIADLFEPGSTMKPFIVAAGLDCGAITPETLIDCEGGKRYLPAKYRPKPIKDEHPMGVVPVEKVLVFSSNIGAGKIAERIVNLEGGEPNKKRLFDYLQAFGFGQKTDVDLPGETASLIRPSWSQWNLNDLLVLAFGTGPVMVTPVTLARAYCALVNGGYRISPRMIKGFVGNRSGEFYEKKVEEGTRIIRPEVANEVARMLVQVVEQGHSNAKSQLYAVGGKTGTAKKVVDGRYSQDHRLLSFAGFAPAHRPKIVVVVMIDEPKGMRYGNDAGAPVFKRIVEETLTYLHIPPDRPEALQAIREKSLVVAKGELEARSSLQQAEDDHDADTINDDVAEWTAAATGEDPRIVQALEEEGRPSQ